MNTLARFLTKASQQKDILLVTVFVTILLMIILPLPTFLMDFLITLNMSAAIIIMLVSLHLHSPVHFSTFPSILLITTLFRLAISISTTRLILVEGNAGEIIDTFGEVVVGGNLIVGLVIFLIITIVQFLVITKGADRVAEVGARFTLDGLPGKQMSVDADLRAGFIDKVDARTSRHMLEREAKLFGAMDGAMKFVKGDAIAGLVITAVNLLGGITIGMAQRGLEFSEALNIYSLMTIGDGLVAQIPALLISVSAGTMVTRVINVEKIDLGTEISQQITANSRTIIIAGIVIALFGLIPGFPTEIFFIVGLSMSGGVFWSQRRKHLNAGRWKDDWFMYQRLLKQILDENHARSGSVALLNLVVPLSIVHFKVTRFSDFFDTTCAQIAQEYGIFLGDWFFEFVDTGNRYEIKLKNQLIGYGNIHVDCVFVRTDTSYLDALGIPYVVNFKEHEGVRVSVDHIAQLQAENIPYLDALEELFIHVETILRQNLHEFVDFQRTSNLLETIAHSDPVLISDLRQNLSNNQISGILKLLLKEQIPIVNITHILETMLEFGPKNPEPLQVLQHVRKAISEFILKRFAPDEFLPVVILAPTLENFLREGLRKTQDESFLVVDSEISTNIANQVKKMARHPFRAGKDPVVLAQQDVRQALFRILKEHGIFIPVVAYQEIPAYIIIYPIGFISPDTPTPQQ